MPRIAAFSAISLTLLAAACQRVPLLAPTGSTITLTALTTALPMNGTTQLVAQVLEASGTPPHSGTHVIFTTTLGTIEPSEAETDVNGRAVSTFKAGNANGTATITAASGGASVAAANVVKIAVGAAAVSSVSASASPTTISSQGGSSTITAKVFDGGGNVLPGIAVTFSTDNGTLSASVANTDASGVATTTLTTNRTAKVTASAGVSTTSSGATPTTTGAPNSSVTVTVNTTGAITIGTVTPAAPTVGQTVAVPLTYPAGAAGTSPVTSLRVDWGDGRIQNYSGQPNVVTHVYGAVGSYLVIVTGLDALGDTSTTSTVIPVAPKPILTVDIASSGAATAGNPVTFTVTATPSAGAAITNVTIDFGDGTPAVSLPGSVKSVVHTFAQSGTYQVTAVATDSSGSTGTGTTVIFVGGITASFTSTAGAAATHTVSFNAAGSTSSSNISTFAWDFGDNSTGTGVTVSHNFPNAGTFTVRLTITDSAGRIASTTQQITAP